MNHPTFRSQFFIPKNEKGEEVTYLCGHSLGLQPKSTKEAILQELEDWKNLGVEGHHLAKNPWIPYHEFVATPLSHLLGAGPNEVVAANSLSVNLQLMLASFYDPQKKRLGVLIEENAFPSDLYALKSHLEVRGVDANKHFHTFKMDPDHPLLYNEEMLMGTMKQLAGEVQLVLLPGVQYLSGQVFNLEKLTRYAHELGMIVGADLAHAIGNVPLELQRWQVDFAVWCSYKYLNGGPGTIGGLFVHQNHLKSNPPLKRLGGWWGQNKERRFKMEANFDPIPTAEGFQLSNPPIFQLAALKASLDIFEEAKIENLRRTSLQLTQHLRQLLEDELGEEISIITPKEEKAQGAQLSLRLKCRVSKNFVEELSKLSLVADFRYPDIMRLTPAPLYNTLKDLEQAVKIIKSKILESWG